MPPCCPEDEGTPLRDAPAKKKTMKDHLYSHPEVDDSVTAFCPCTPLESHHLARCELRVSLSGFPELGASDSGFEVRRLCAQTMAGCHVCRGLDNYQGALS